MWAYVKPTTPEKVQPTANEIVPKVKLTGTGKMPVMDMRSQSLKSQQSQHQYQNQQLITQQQQHPLVSGLPPKSPVYAAGKNIFCQIFVLLIYNLFQNSVYMLFDIPTQTVYPGAFIRVK